MSDVLNEVLNANREYSQHLGEKGKLTLPPARRFAVLTCMAARLDPAKFAGLSEGDAHVIRNARRASERRCYPIPGDQLQAARNGEFFVIHHIDCGQFVTNEVIRGLLASSLETAELTTAGFRDVGKGAGSRAGDALSGSLSQSRNRRSWTISPAFVIIPSCRRRFQSTDIYDVRSGRLIEVEEATSAGRASSATEVNCAHNVTA